MLKIVLVIQCSGQMAVAVAIVLAQPSGAEQSYPVQVLPRYQAVVEWLLVLYHQSVWKE